MREQGLGGCCSGAIALALKTTQLLERNAGNNRLETGFSNADATPGHRSGVSLTLTLFKRKFAI
jgi:hypothetical protein